MTLSAKSEKKVKDNIDRLYFYMRKNNLCFEFDEDEPLDWLTSVDVVLKAIQGNKNWSSEDTHKSILSSIATLLRNIPEYKEVYEWYSQKVCEYSTRLQQTYRQNRLNQNKSVVKWKEIIEARNKEEYEKLFPHDKLLYHMYTDIPPRRLLDYCVLVYDPCPEVITDEMNYITKKGELVLNKYKTAKTYKEYRTKLPESIFELILEVKQEVPDPWITYIFRKSDVEMSKYVKEVFSKLLGVELTLNDIRKAWVSSWVNDSNISEFEKSEKVKDFGSSLQMARNSYLKLELQ
jgi:hypothetical protein